MWHDLFLDKCAYICDKRLNKTPRGHKCVFDIKPLGKMQQRMYLQ